MQAEVETKMLVNLEHYTSISALCSTFNHVNGGRPKCLTAGDGCAWMKMKDNGGWNPHGAG